MNKKMTLLAGAICSVLSSAAMAGVDDIIITQYVEGSGSRATANRAIEITNIGKSAYTFANTNSLSLYYETYSAKQSKFFVNQVQDQNGDNILANHTLAPGKSLVVVSAGTKAADMKSAISASGGQVVEVTGTGYHALGFTGRSPVWLGTDFDTQTTDRSVVQASVKDIFGELGYQGSAKWNDHTYRRNEPLPQAQSNTYDENQWTRSAKDDFSGLGVAGSGAAGTGGSTTKTTGSGSTPSTASNPCTGSNALTIGEVQGSGYKSPLIDGKYESNHEYEVTGVVSAINKNKTIAQGFYLYDDNADGNDKTSDGLFVKTGADTSNLKVGQEVCVRGKIKEDYGMTAIIPTGDVWEVTKSSAVSPTPVNLKRIATDTDKFRSTLERLEGMPVKLVQDMDDQEPEAQDMRVTRSFSFDYDGFRNNMVLAYKRPNPQPNQNFVAGSDEAKAQSAENRDYRLYIESDEKAKGGDIPYYPDFIKNPKDNYIRVNDSVTGLEGVLHYSHNEFRLIPTNTLTKSNFKHNTPRVKAPKMASNNNAYPEDAAFNIRIATQNVLNYFNSPFGGADNTHGADRGAKSQQEFEHQQAKIVEAIYNLDADIIGLMEIENNGFGDRGAINELLRALNRKYYDDKYHKRYNDDGIKKIHYDDGINNRYAAKSMQNRYVFVGFDSNGDTVLDGQDSIGGDVITTGLIYRPSKVRLIAGKVIPMPEQHTKQAIKDKNGEPLRTTSGEIIEDGNNYQRNTIAATFRVLNTGKRLTVAVNHLKSKGSPCYEDWKDWQSWKNFDISKQRNTRALDFDHQGHCENFRVAAAYQLGTEMAKIKGDKVLLGDMNAYAHEDPLLVLTSNPTHKKLMAAGDTYIGKRPLFDSAGQEINTSFGYLNAVELKTPKGETAWSYSFAGEIGSLDHLLISPTLKPRLIDAKDSHINAAESSLYDYNNKYKGGSKDNPNPFYSADPYRSSDHDSAIVTLGYKYNEAGENPVTIGLKSGRADIFYPVPATAKTGDVATLSISPAVDRAAAVPKVTLAKDGAQFVRFDASNLSKGQYSVTMQLTRASAKVATRSNDSVVARDGDKVIDSKTVQVDLVKRDSKNVKPTYPESDGSGGAFGLGTLLAMFGFGFLRRRRY